MDSDELVEDYKLGIAGLDLICDRRTELVGCENLREGCVCCHDQLEGDLKWFGEKPQSLCEAIELAVNSKLRTGNHHAHQCKLRKTVYGEAKKKLNERLDKLDSIDSFDVLYDEIYCAISSIRGIGPLAIYDFTLRVAAYKDIWPKEYVYLHAGALEAVLFLETKKLVVKTAILNNPRRIELSALPEQIRDLGSVHAENFLCIYKGCFI